jgi:hypothetical protein
MSLRPSLRRDLVVRPVHRRGQRLIELRDPNTGSCLWLSDLGYSVAFLMNGSDLRALMLRAKEALHIDMSSRRLERFAERLAAHGMLVGSEAVAAHDTVPVEAGAGVGSPPPIAWNSDVRPPAAITAVEDPPAPPGEEAATVALSPAELALVLTEAAERGGLPTGEAARRAAAGSVAPPVVDAAPVVAPRPAAAARPPSSPGARSAHQGTRPVRLPTDSGLHDSTSP